MLLRPEIHWNTGNVGRSCLAAGAQLHLVGPLGFSLSDRRLRRAGLDYWERVRPRLCDDWPDLEAALPGLGAPWLFSAEGERCYWDVDYSSACVLVFGPESQGLPRALRERHRERVLRLPMRDPALRSLNLSSTVAVALFEVMRQRSGPRDRHA